MTKLTHEDKDYLRDVLGSPAWPVVLKLLDMQVERREKLVLEFPLHTHQHKDLVLYKAEMDGAKATRTMFQNISKILKESSDGDD